MTAAEGRNTMALKSGGRGTTSWSEVRQSKIAPGDEPAVKASAQALRDALALSELRVDRGMTQAQLAERLGKSQGNISELERRDDVYLSSLREYVEALGGRLEIKAVFEDKTNVIDLMAALDASVNAAKSAREDRARAVRRRVAAESA